MGNHLIGLDLSMQFKISTHNICSYKENQKQEKRLTALWTGFLNNEENKSCLSCM